MPQNWQPIEAPDPKKAMYLQQQRDFEKNLFLIGIGLFIFVPFLAILPVLITMVYSRDFLDFENPYKNKLKKSKLYVFMYLFVSFFAFYFLVFPLIPTKIPIWGFWASLTFIHDIIINAILFAGTTGAVLYLTYKYVKPWFDFHYFPYDKLVGTDNYLIIPTEKHGIINISEINTGMMVLGATGAGKTEFIKQIIYQFPKERDYIWVIFDPKGDYLNEFGDRKKDIILSISVHDATYAWNVFREIAPEDPLKAEEMIKEDVMQSGSEEQEQEIEVATANSSNTEEKLRRLTEEIVEQKEERKKSFENSDYEDPQVVISEIMGNLFKDLTESSQDKFWNFAAQQVLEGIVYIMYNESLHAYKEMYDDWKESHEIWEEVGREGDEPEKPNFYDFLPSNSYLYERVTKSTLEEIHGQLMNYPELRMVAGYLDPKSKKMAGSVWAVLGTQFRRIFQGTFGKEGRYLKQISMKEYAKNPNGRMLFVEYEIEKGNVLSPIYRVLLDRISGLSLNGRNKDVANRRKFFVIDEFQNVPKLNLYGQIVNYGRALNVTSIIGIQTLTQVVEAYGRDATNSIISGHRFVFAFGVTDEEGTKFVTERIGKEEMWIRRPVQISGAKSGSLVVGAEYQRIEYTPIKLGKIHYWKVGEMVMIVKTGFKKVRPLTFHEAKPKIDYIQNLIKKREEELKKYNLRKKKQISLQTMTAWFKKVATAKKHHTKPLSKITLRLRSGKNKPSPSMEHTKNKRV